MPDERAIDAPAAPILPPSAGGGVLMRSDNLRAAPGLFTPDMVRRVLEQLHAPQVIEASGAPVIKITPAKPALRVVSRTAFDPPSGGTIRSGKDGPKEKPGAASRQSSGAARAVPAEPVSPPLNPPVAHSRRSEEEEAATSAPTLDRGEPLTTASPLRQEICEATHRTPRQAVRSAAPREPAPPAPQQARAHPLSDRAKIDAANKRRADAVGRRVVAKAEAFIDAGKTIGKGTNVHLKLAVRAVELKRAEEQRQGCPIETAKTLLRRRFAPVCSMAVYDGDPALFCVGHRKNLTVDELLAMAAKVSA